MRQALMLNICVLMQSIKLKDKVRWRVQTIPMEPHAYVWDE